MKATAFYRTAAVLLVLFAVGHTIGFLRFTPPNPEGIAVRQAMDNVHFVVMGSSFSYGGFYRGFGLFITAYLLFSAILAWQFGGLARLGWQGIAPVAWAFFGVQVVSLILALMYFAVPPAVFSAAVAACVGCGAWQAHAGASRTI